jgi:hypothetical protein
MAFGFRVREGLVNLAGLQRYLVSTVFYAEEKIVAGLGHTLSAQEALDPDILAPHPMRFIPVYLSSGHSAVGEANQGHAFELPPPAWTETLLELVQITNRTAHRDDFDLGYLTKNLDFHWRGQSIVDRSEVEITMGAAAACII